MLAVGKLLKAREASLNGTVRLLFRPVEETTGGAADMIAEGCMEAPGVSAVLGFHVDPSLPAHCAAFFPGIMNAAVTDFTLTVQGRGCHGAHPDEGVDAIVAAAQIISTLQSAVSRSIAPTASGVVTIGTRENIIANSVTMTGTIRALLPEIQQRLKDTLQRIAENTAAAFSTTVQLNMEDLYPALINDGELTRKMFALARDLLGAQQVLQMPEPGLGADDFAFFSNRVPGCYFNVGAHCEGMPGQTLHSPTFVPHEGSMETALLLLSAGALSCLQNL